MAAPHPYPAALSWDRGPEDLKKLKNRLLLHFRSKDKSDGGDCVIPDTNCDQGVILIHFKEEAVRDRVLQKTHELKLGDGKTLRLTVSLPDSGDTKTGKAPPPSPGAVADVRASGNPKERAQSAALENRDHPVGGASVGPPDSAGGREASLQHSGRGERDQGGDSGRHGHTDPRDYSSSQRRPPQDGGGPGEESFSSSSDLLSGEGQGPVPKDRDHPAGPYSISQRAGAAQPDPQMGDPDHRGPQSPGSHRPGGAAANDGPEESPNVSGSPDSAMDHGALNPQHSMQEIFGPVTLKLCNEKIPAPVREEVIERFSSLTINTSADWIEVTGTFDEIAAVHRYLQERIGAGPENSPDTRSGETLPEREEDLLSVSSALLEYVMEIYRSDLEDIERSYEVKIVQHSTAAGSTYLKFISQGSQTLLKAAKEVFTDKVQKVLGDWSQETVDSAIAQLPFSDIKQRVKSLWSNVLVIQQDRSIILRGPGDQISQAKKLLEKGETERSFSEKTEYKSTPAHSPVTLSSDMVTEIPVDRGHLDILRRLKIREISDIEQKYRVMMEEKDTNTKDGNVLVTFRAVNGPPDLSPHACRSFITLLQKTFFNIKSRVISLRPDYPQERVHSLQEELRAGGMDIIMNFSGGSLQLIGHPLHVDFAIESLSGNPETNGAQAAGISAMDNEEPMDTSESKDKQKTEEEDNKCAICLSEFNEKEILPKCKHAFCRECLKQAMAHKPVCPICLVPYGEIRGDQPDGTMSEMTSRSSLPGYPGCGTIEITYNIPSGIQQANQPHPGARFQGATRTAYLPDNPEGREVLRLLRKAFDRRLIFTVGDSRTTGATNTVTWNDIHHKTSTRGGAAGFGYPDPDYLKRVREELKAKGIEE